MADEDAIYKNAAPNLFGEGFTKKAKERDDELRVLQKATRQAKPQQETFFREGRPPARSGRGGNSNGFRGRRSFRPHQYKSFNQRNGSGSGNQFGPRPEKKISQ